MPSAAAISTVAAPVASTTHSSVAPPSSAARSAMKSPIATSRCAAARDSARVADATRCNTSDAAPD